MIELTIRNLGSPRSPQECWKAAKVNSMRRPIRSGQSSFVRLTCNVRLLHC